MKSHKKTIIKILTRASERISNGKDYYCCDAINKAAKDKDLCHILKDQLILCSTMILFDVLYEAEAIASHGGVGHEALAILGYFGTHYCAKNQLTRSLALLFAAEYARSELL